MRKNSLIFIFFCLTTCALNAQTNYTNRQTNTPTASKEQELSQQDIFTSVLQQLGLTENDINLSLFVHDSLPQSTDLSVMVIPKYTKKADGSSGADFYIFVVENSSGKIKQQYCQPDSVWASNLGDLPYITFPQIKIDTLTYQLNSELSAFAIRAGYSINSSASPHDLTYLCLFISKGDALIPVLNNYPIYEYKGDFDHLSGGKFIHNEGIISIDNKQTNKLNNIIIKHKITTTNINIANDNYNTKEHVSYRTTKLKFNKTEYK